MNRLFNPLTKILLLMIFLSIAVAEANQTKSEQHRIQLAILLDTSNSMDGLIDQTRAQLWSMVDELSKAKKNGQAAKLEVAVLEYGNQGLAKNSGYIRRVVNLTSDLDRVSEALFSLQTNGGDEYCGYAIQTAVKDLQWSRSAEDLKLIYIAGNEPFTQGPVDYRNSIKDASTKGITVSTIFAGEQDEGVASGWQSGALLAGGNFMNVDQNQAVVHIAAPQDQQLLDLNAQLNNTYVPYGPKGLEAKTRQESQDAANTAMSVAVMGSRIKSKASAVYKNAQWDLVDAMEEEDFDVESIAAENLPQPMVTMSTPEKEAWLMEKKQEREKIKQEINDLSKARDQYVAEEREKLAAKEAAGVEDVLTESIKRQAEKLDYSFN